MISEWEVWACAEACRKRHGEGAGAHAERRQLDLAAAGDQEGARVWAAIADRIEQLDAPTAGPLN